MVAETLGDVFIKTNKLYLKIEFITIDVKRTSCYQPDRVNKQDTASY